MQRLPSQVPLPRLLTRPGMFLVSNSSTLCKMPLLLRKPTMTLGTPSRNDWTQNFSSFRSYLSMSLSFSISAEVFNSTQLMGPSLLFGLQSHTGWRLACSTSLLFPAYQHPLRLQWPFLPCRYQSLQLNNTEHNCSQPSPHAPRWNLEK